MGGTLQSAHPATGFLLLLLLRGKKKKPALAAQKMREVAGQTVRK
jgi:hypothetical protein